MEHNVSASRSLLHDIRSRYRSVTHLWTAWCIRGRAIRSDPDVGCEGWHDFQFFLAEAEILQRWGRTWRAERAKAEPPLSAEAWRVPDGCAHDPARHDVGRLGGVARAPGTRLPLRLERFPTPPRSQRADPKRKMAERLKAHAWRACVPGRVPWVRIPLSPPSSPGVRRLRAGCACRP